jgi:anaerobic ribonucleoside-triphosphate reductase activating protein
MRLAGIVRDSIVDGVGIRDVIFVQGCYHKCPGCHNQQTWDFQGGEHWFNGDIIKELSDSDNDITISGGDPMFQFSEVYRLVQLIRHKTNKRVWLYTGNTITVPIQNAYRKLAPYVDVIVDGRFIEELKDSNLLFRGSSNQRIIDLPKTVKANKIVLWEECE